jgi:hypothetical protein
MNCECEHGNKIVKGFNIYILCSLTKFPCSFQRYCVSKQDVINTEGAKTCVSRTKKDVTIEENVAIDEEFLTEKNPKEELFVDEEKKETIKKEFGTVFLISKNGVCYNYNGQSRYMAGKFNLKIGDKIQV